MKLIWWQTCAFVVKNCFFTLHVENQAKAQPDFGKRMFRYFARLYEKFALPVYPIALFSYDAPQRPTAKLPSN